MAKTYTLANAPVLDATGQQIKTALIAKTALLKRVGAKIKQDSDIAIAAFVQKSASGSIASFTDGADGVPVKSLSADVNLVQEGSGDPSPENVRPIYGHTAAAAHRTGFNIWDEEWEQGFYSITTGEKVANALFIRSTNFIPVAPSTDYFFKAPTQSSRVLYYDREKQFIDITRAFADRVFTTPANCHFVTFFTSGTTYNHDVYINYPSTETTYHAYEGDTYTVSFGQTVYGGALDFTTGVLTVTYGIVDLGTLTWVRNAAATNPVFYATVTGIKPSAKLVSEIYNYRGAFGALTTFADFAQNGDIASSTEIERIYVRAVSYTDAASFKSAMSGVQLAYELATPQTFQLTPQEIKTLYGKNNIWADTGNVDLVYRAAPADIPLPPTEDGVYILKATVADGAPVIEWASNE